MAAKYDSSGNNGRGTTSPSSDTYGKNKLMLDADDSDFDEFGSDVERSVPMIPYTTRGQLEPTSQAGNVVAPVAGGPGGYHDVSWKMQSLYSDRVGSKQPSPTGMMAWVGFGCCLFALACLTLSFCSPYWLQTWPMSENRFRNIGLWNVCFYNYMHFKDDSQQVYSGCWWLFDRQPKYYKLREWLTPPWFITCQVLTTGCLIVEIVTVITTALIFLHFCPLLNHEYLQTYGLFASASMMFLVAMVSFVVAVLFGAYINDRYWLPRPDQNFLSWGFGFLVISMIFALFAGVCLFHEAWKCYNLLLKKEDEYTKSAIQMSFFPSSDVTDNRMIVAPGSSAIQPPSYTLHDVNRDQSYVKPVHVSTTYSSQLPNDELDEPTTSSSTKKPLLSDVYDTTSSSTQKPLPSDVYDVETPATKYTTPASFGGPSSAPYGRVVEPSRTSGISIPPVSEQPRQTAAFGGKSFAKSYERQYSDDSFDDPALEEFVTKVERQY